MKWRYNDGGRAEAGYKGSTGDCAVRSLAIVTGKSYQEIYDTINEVALTERTGSRKRGKSNARTGVYKATFRKVAEALGLKWQPTMFIGSGCKVHLKDGELPMGRLIVSVSKHYTAVIDGVINDIHNPQRQTLIVENGNKRIAERCVYGYFYQ
jgi:hypothetical protein